MDTLLLLLLGGFASFVVVAGAIFLQKKRRERIDALEKALNAPEGDPQALTGVDAPLQLPASTGAEPVRRADELGRLEREALEAKAKADEAARERARAEQQVRDAEEKKRQLAEEEERLAKEREQRAKEQAAREEQERQERERLEQLRVEQERLVKEAKEQAEQERLAKEQAEREEQERIAAARRAQEQAEREEHERQEQERLAKLRAEQERLAKEQAEQEAKLAQARAAELVAKEAADAAAQRVRELRQALSKTREGFVGKLAKVIAGQKEISADLLDDIEAVLFTADVGSRTAEHLLNTVKARLSSKELTDASKIQDTLKQEVRTILTSVSVKPLQIDGDGPRVVMVVGVNGAGKTTTIGKLAKQLKDSGKNVLLGAGDTFRAAASDQLEVWADRAGCPIVVGKANGDPSAVLFDTVKRASDEKFDVVLCDTAGRLHTKVNLMEELRKVHRVIGKGIAGAPHEVLLVLDATVGQNAISQAKQFGEAVPLTGIILTKLDGTAKGGVVIGIVKELGIPVRYIGVGEKISDLRPFDPEMFITALFDD